MGGIKLRIHPLFLVFGVFLFFTGQGVSFIIYTLSALVHEIGHSITAGEIGYKLNRITLMPYGAIVSGDTDFFKPSDQLKIALSGPAVNLLIALIFVAFWWIFPESYAFTDQVVMANFSIALINFLPVFPLDGGRILYSLLAIKFSKKTARIVSRTIGIIFAGLPLCAFVLTCFHKINLSLLFFGLFVIFGVFDKRPENAYVKAYTVLSVEKLKKGVPVKKTAVDDGVTVKKMISLLDNQAVNELEVYSQGKKRATLSQERINGIIEKANLYDKIEKYC